MIVTANDPVFGNTISDPINHPFIGEGRCMGAMKLHGAAWVSRHFDLKEQADNPGLYCKSERPSHY